MRRQPLHTSGAGVLLGYLLACGETANTGERGPTGGAAAGGRRGDAGFGGEGQNGGGGTGAGGTGDGGTSPDAGDDAPGSTGGIGGTADGGTPNDLPLRPEWTPDYLPLGEPGWRGSQEAFCSPDLPTTRPSVWSSSDGVYLLVNQECNTSGPLRPPCTPSGAEGAAALYRNSGSGWSLLYESEQQWGGLTGVPGGPAVLWGGYGNCGVLQVLADGSAVCIEPADETRESQTAAVGGSSLYVLYYGAYEPSGELNVTLREYVGGAWVDAFSTSLSTVVATPSVVASEQSVLFVTRNAAWIRRTPRGSFEPLPDVPAGDYTAAWVFGPDDVVLGNAVGQLLRFDGAEWTRTDAGTDAIYGVWGAPDGVLYFILGGAQLGRLSGGVIEMFGRPRGDTDSHTLRQLWGNSSSEVFVALGDGPYAQYQCGNLFVVWFDGTEFHQF